MANPIDTEDDDVSLLDLLKVIVENLRLLVFGPLVVGLLALGVSFLITPSFTATTRILPPQQQQSSAAMMLQNLGALGGLASAATGLKNPNDQFVSFLNSNAVRDRLIERFALMKRYEAEFREDARKKLGELAAVSSGKDGLISIAVDDTDPAFAADLANAHVQELAALLSRLAVTEAQQRRAFFENQLTQTRDKLVQAELALKSSGVNSSALKSDPAAAVQAVAQLQAQIAAQEVKLGSMRSYLAESAPDFKQAQAELALLRNQLGKLERSSTAPAAADADYVARFRDFKYYETLFELFARQYELAKVDESREGAIIQVVDAATPPDRKSKPKKALIAVVATLGFGFFLLMFVFVRSALRNAAQTPASAQKVADLRRAWHQAIGRTT